MIDSHDPHGPDDNWIPRAEYDLIQKRVPILCVDLLPLNSTGQKIGLILRETYAGNKGWCLIGGAVRRNQNLLESVKEHVKNTLGEKFTAELSSPEPLTIIEYFPEPERGKFYDPRKHAVALTYAARCSGEVDALGEAIHFDWFDRDKLDQVNFGFGQGAVVEQVLGLLESQADRTQRSSQPYGCSSNS